MFDHRKLTLFSISYLLIAILTSLDSSQAQNILTLPKVSAKRCNDMQDSSSCYEVGMLYYNTSVQKDRDTGLTYILKGCKIEMSRACETDEALLRAKIAVREQKKIDKSIHNKKLELTADNSTREERSCWMESNAKACDIAATDYMFLAKVTDKKKALSLYREGCRLGYENSCGTVRLIEKGIVRVFNVEVE